MVYSRVPERAIPIIIIFDLLEDITRVSSNLRCSHNSMIAGDCTFRCEKTNSHIIISNNTMCNIIF